MRLLPALKASGVSDGGIRAHLRLKPQGLWTRRIRKLQHKTIGIVTSPHVTLGVEHLERSLAVQRQVVGCPQDGPGGAVPFQSRTQSHKPRRGVPVDGDRGRMIPGVVLGRIGLRIYETRSLEKERVRLSYSRRPRSMADRIP